MTVSFLSSARLLSTIKLYRLWSSLRVMNFGTFIKLSAKLLSSLIEEIYITNARLLRVQPVQVDIEMLEGCKDLVLMIFHFLFSSR